MLLIFKIILGHFFGDFMFQPRIIALNKNKRIDFLFYHCIIYSGALSITIGYYYYKFILLIFLSHLVIDFVTSKLSFHFKSTEQETFFWWNIGFDQSLHFITIFCILFYFI